jgi:hypothetical protein
MGEPHLTTLEPAIITAYRAFASYEFQFRGSNIMPVIDFQDLDEYDAAIEFLVGKGVTFHTRPPQRLVLGAGDFKALEEANIVRSAKGVRSRGKKTRPSSKPKAGGAS